MNFSSIEKITSVISSLKDADIRRAPNRTLVNQLFNGSPPYTKDEVDSNHIQVNVNWGEGSDLLLQGREQLENAHLSTDFAFTIRMPDAPASKRTMWGGEATVAANALLKKSMPYLHTAREKWGSVILHGTGTQLWEDRYKWKPYFVGIDDLLIPTDTTLTYENLNHFAVRRRMSPGQLYRKTFGLPEANRDSAWQMKAVQKVLDRYKDKNQSSNTWNWAEHPEKAAEIWKQNASFFDSDAVPVILMWDFYYQEDDDAKGSWFRKIILDSDCVSDRPAGTDGEASALYTSEVAFADNLGEILHTQFLDGNNVPPFMYHSTRGLGMRLYDGVHMLNRLRCQSMQKTFEDLMLLFRAQDPMDRARLDQIYMGLNYGIVPEGLTFVTRDQRYAIDPELLQMQLSQLKQLIGEGSQQYTQDIDNGTAKQRTAFEVNTLLNQTTRLTGSMLNLSYLQEGFAYEEICRRLTIKDSLDWDVKRFQNRMLQAGVPSKWIDSSRWEIEPVRVLGSGNSQLEQGQAQALLGVRPMLNPEAQNEVLHDYVFAITHDPKRANRLAPLDAVNKVTDTVADTERVFGALLAGSKVNPRPGLIAAEVVSTMIGEMGAMVQEVQQQGGVGTPQQVQGLQAAGQYAGTYLQQLAQDVTAKDTVKQFSDQLGQIMNLVKAMAQRQQEMAAQAQQQGPDPAVMAKVQGQQALDQQKLQSNAQKHAQQMSQKQQKFQADMRLKQAQAITEEGRKAEQHRGDQQRSQMQSLADIQNATMQATAEAGRKPPEPKTEGE